MEADLCLGIQAIKASGQTDGKHAESGIKQVQCGLLCVMCERDRSGVPNRFLGLV